MKYELEADRTKKMHEGAVYSRTKVEAELEEKRNLAAEQEAKQIEQ